MSERLSSGVVDLVKLVMADNGIGLHVFLPMTSEFLKIAKKNIFGGFFLLSLKIREKYMMYLFEQLVDYVE